MDLLKSILLIIAMYLSFVVWSSLLKLKMLNWLKVQCLKLVFVFKIPMFSKIPFEKKKKNIAEARQIKVVFEKG